MVLPPGSDAERASFAELQDKLRDRFLRFSADPRQPYTAVVIPSQTFDRAELEKISGVAHYEERSLFNLMLLRHPRLKVVFVTSKRLNPLIVDYYLHQMRSVPSAHARRRLILLDCDDASPRPLTEKILERPLVLDRIRASIDDVEMAHMVVFNSTPLERTLSVQLGIPLNAPDPELTHLGSKSGARAIFAEAGVAVMPGREGLRDAVDLRDATAELAGKHGAKRVVVKLDEGFSGEGNGIITVPDNPTPTAIDAAIREVKLEAEGLDWPTYEAQLEAMGGICELWLEGARKASPSVQMRVNPLREVQVLSTHDQVLGGPGGQVFCGATFPAAPIYRRKLMALGRQVGAVLAERGVIGRFGVDFITALPNGDAPNGGAGRADVSGEDEPTLYALEINLRQGGTTHPFNTLKFLTGGSYDDESGEFFTAQGQARSYYATDTLASETYRGILPFDLIDALVLNGIHFRADETGVVFHLLGCQSENGKLGCTAIAGSVDDAVKLHDEAVAVIESLSPSPRR